MIGYRSRVGWAARPIQPSPLAAMVICIWILFMINSSEFVKIANTYSKMLALSKFSMK